MEYYDTQCDALWRNTTPGPHTTHPRLYSEYDIISYFPFCILQVTFQQFRDGFVNILAKTIDGLVDTTITDEVTDPSEFSEFTEFSFGKSLLLIYL